MTNDALLPFTLWNVVKVMLCGGAVIMAVC